MQARQLFLSTALAVPLGLGTASVAHGNVLETLRDSDQFGTLVRALGAAEMESALEGAGPFTIFAPTDRAFEALPQDTAEALLEEGNRDQLERLINLHIVESERLTRGDIEEREGSQVEVQAVAGETLTVDASGSEMLVRLAARNDGFEAAPDDPAADRAMPARTPDGTGGAGQTGAQAGGALQEAGTAATATYAAGAFRASEARVVEADIEAENGVVHAIDGILIPEDVLAELQGAPGAPTEDLGQSG